MMGKKKAKSNYDRPSTVIGKDTVIETAKLESKQSVQINGKIIGDLNVSASVVVGQVGIIEGNIEAGFVLVAGKVIGNIKVSQQIHLTKSAVVIGNIDCQSIIIDDGAKIQGSFEMHEVDDSAATVRSGSSDSNGDNKKKKS